MKNNKRYIIAFSLIILLLLFLSLLNLASGSTAISFGEIVRIVLARGDNSEHITIIESIRLPRLIAVIFLTGALALSGYMLQTFFANPIAGPFVLGISSSAKLFVAILMVISCNYGFNLNSSMMVMAALLGSAMSTVFVLAVSKRVMNMSVLIICGIMVGYICSALTEFIVAFADDNNIVNLHNWAMGSFSGLGMKDVIGFVPIIMLALILSIISSKTIAAYLFGEHYAYSLGINVKFFRFFLIAISSVLSAVVTAFAGPVSFVGIAVPHIVRKIFKSSKPGIMIMGSFLTGAAFGLFCDLIARCMFAPMELSISTITAIFGAPVVIAMMIDRKKKIRI